MTTTQRKPQANGQAADPMSRDAAEARIAGLSMLVHRLMILTADAKVVLAEGAAVYRMYRDFQVATRARAKSQTEDESK